ncbi:VacJ family lipoprotein [Acidisphaera sp. L21]|uniref:MlaA family lipoprotein n=1 Tax=Acidisphaera sp. L21 TaxID=1641851 RepID=UPI00131E6DB7|nr:VacJ family lipoprotein [Acidisphaera sp. L21]
MRLRILPPALATLVLLLGACAPKPPVSEPDELADYNERNDPLEPTNRTFYAVNHAIDANALRPVASGYRSAVPESVRNHVHNTLSNLGNPAQFTNDVLQGHPRKAGNTFMRLLINTTVGVGGVFDVASGWGFPDHDNDFGLTMAVWGIPGGPFLFLPVLGPSNPRDGVGYGANSALDPFTWVSFGGSATFGWTRFGIGAVDSRARVLTETDSIEKTALDPYATYRTLYQQHREGEVEAARGDLPATVPAWYASPADASNGNAPAAAQQKTTPIPHITR